MSTNKKLNVFKVKDVEDSFKIKKDLIPDIPFRISLIGKPQLSGKTNLLINMVCRPDMYGLDFKGENIYIVSDTAWTDQKMKKMIQFKEIPEENIFVDFDEEILEAIYDGIQDEYNLNVETGNKPENYCFIFDDLGYKGSLKGSKFGVMSRIACNGRHIGLSCFILVQKYTQLSTTFRESLTGCVCFSCSQKQLEMIVEEHNYTASKKAFMNAFRYCTNDKHSFFLINYCQPVDKRYSKNFETFIDINDYEKPEKSEKEEINKDKKDEKDD